jgi:transposase
MTGKAKRAQYTLEFKLEAVRLVKAGQSMAAVAATLGVVEQTLYNWVKADREGKLAGAGAKPVSPEQMELARLRAEVARLKMERDILKNIRRGAPLPKGQKLRPRSTLATLKGAAVRLLVIDPVKKHGPGTDAAPALVTP